MSVTTERPAGATAVRPFRVDTPQAALDDLRSRVVATRLPERETVDDESQGVRLATMQALIDYWGSDYDWRRCEAELNALPQFVSEIDGLDIHFIHVRSRHEDALPVIVTHGWPGSVIEQLKIIGPLTDPTAHGGSASDAFHVVIPSLPGYGFSGKPESTGWGPPRVARAWDTLMQRLGYTNYVAQGGDWGAIISEVFVRLAPPGLLGIAINLMYTRLPEIAQALRAGGPPPAGMSEEEQAAYAQLSKNEGAGRLAEMGTRPQTIGYGMTAAPAGLASFLVDHDAKSLELIASAFAGHPGGLSRDDVLDNITLYWLTDSAASSARLYWEAGRSPGGGLTLGDFSTPVAVTVFPDETYRTPRSWAERVYPNLIYYDVAAKGGHFAAWEQPELFATQVRAAFRPLRSEGGPS
jgi:pimeloyl-ACP methyl ester carboxylesterase